MDLGLASSSWQRALAPSVLLLAFGAFLPPVAAQSVRLNGPLAGPDSDVTEFALDSTQTVALYVADQDVAGVRELYAVPIDLSAAPTKLSAPLSGNADVGGVRIGPSGQVVYGADPTTDQEFALFGTTIDGSLPPVQLSGPMTPGGTVASFSLSPDGAWVVYRADQDTDDFFELFAAPTDGSAPAHEVHTLPLEVGLSVYRIDPTSTNVLYEVESYNGGQGPKLIYLYATPLDASSASLQLAQVGNGSGFSQGILSIGFSPDGTWTDCLVSIEVTFETALTLHLVPVDGSLPARKLDGGLSVLASLGSFTADGGRVVWGTTFTFAGGNPTQNLFTATLTGPRVALDMAETGNHSQWLLDATSGTAYFAQSSGVYRVPADGSAAQTLLSPIASGTCIALELSPDGTRLAFVVQATNGSRDLLSVPSAGGATVSLGQFPSGPPLSDVRISPDSRQVGFRWSTSPSVHELFLAPLAGGHGAIRINDPLPTGGTVQSGFAFVPPATTLYLASQQANGIFELFKASAFEWKRWRLGPPGPIPPP